MIQRWLSVLLQAGILVAMWPRVSLLAARFVPVSSYNRSTFNKFVESHCLDCHDQAAATAGLALDTLMGAEIGPHLEAWEKVVRKLSARQMPPPDSPRPEEDDYVAAVKWLESSLDSIAAARPNPGRTETFRRLTRIEYQNAIRDLLELEIDAASLLPADESSYGFSNITVSDLSPALLSRYLSAAQTIGRLAVGRRVQGPKERS